VDVVEAMMRLLSRSLVVMLEISLIMILEANQSIVNSINSNETTTISTAKRQQKGHELTRARTHGCSRRYTPAKAKRAAVGHFSHYLGLYDLRLKGLPVRCRRARRACDEKETQRALTTNGLILMRTEIDPI
jgi:hypothetical protein